VTLILVDIALQQNLKSLLPATDYLTAMVCFAKIYSSLLDCGARQDKFIWISFTFKIFVLLWVGVPLYPIFPKSIFSNAETTNRAATWFFALAFLFYICGIFIYFIMTQQSDRRKNFKSSKELQVSFGIEDDPMYRVAVTNTTCLVLHYPDDDQLYVCWRQQSRQFSVLSVRSKFSGNLTPNFNI